MSGAETASTAIVTGEPADAPASTLVAATPYERGLEPRGLGEALRVATVLAGSRLNGLQGEADALARIMAGREIGLTTMQAIMGSYAFDTKTAGRKIGFYAEVLEAICIRHPECEAWDWIQRDEKGAKLRVKRRGRAEQIISFGEEDALRAGLLDRGATDEAKKTNNYNRYPRRMYVARCRAEAASLMFPDATRGFKSREELELETGELPHTPGDDATPSIDIPQLREMNEKQTELLSSLKLRLSSPGLTKDARLAVRTDIEQAEREGRLTGAFLAEAKDAYNESAPKGAAHGVSAKGATGPSGGGQS